MIIIILGGTGSGKTLSVVREILISKNFPVTNFEIKNIRYHRLRYQDLLNLDEKKKPVSVNWAFWDEMQKKHPDFSIYLDEAHEVINSRSSISKRNQLMSNWCSQVRKILGDSETNHLFIISQTWRKIDVNFRELAHMVIVCRKKIVNGRVVIIRRYFEGDMYNPMRPELMRMQRPKKDWFIGNNFFGFYDSKARQRFSEGDEYV